MRNLIIACCSIFIGWNSGMCWAELPTPTPRPGIVVYLRDPIEKIIDLRISDGLKRFLLAELYTQYGEYEKALELLDDTISVEISGRQFAVEQTDEYQVLFAYLRQKIQHTRQAKPDDVIRQEQVQYAGDAQYETALAYKELQKLDKAIQALLDALEAYQEIDYAEGQMLVRYELALLYTTLAKPDKAAQHAQEFITLFHSLPMSAKYDAMRELVYEE